MLPTHGYTNLFSMQVIESPYMTKTIIKKVVKHFRPGERMGKDKRLKKTIVIGAYVVPDTSIIRVGNRIVCHPIMANHIKNEIARANLPPKRR